MSDKERCKNCLEPLCPAGSSCREEECDGCLVHSTDEWPHHSDDGTDANDLCTRATAAEVKGCNECGLSRTRYCCPPIYHYGWTPGQSSVPDWRPIIKGPTLRAVLPAEEKEG